MPYTKNTRYEKMYPLFLCYSGLLLLAALVLDRPEDILRGLWVIVTSEDTLITDYVKIAGPGGALANSALVTAFAAWVLRMSKEPLNGFSMVVIGLMSGFSLFGKNILNIWPIVLGTWLYAKVRKERFGKYVTVALMSTALAPIISYIALDNGWGHPIWGLAAGLLIGFVMPPLSAYTYKLQNGMNLYNLGFACGLVGMLLVPLMTAMGADPNTYYRWATGYSRPFGTMLCVLCIALIVGGLFFCKTPWWAALAGYRRLLRTTGRAPSDYLRMFGFAPVFINAGVNGLIGTAYILLTGGELNGPTVGGILTIMGFSAFGKHARNIVPVMTGVFLGAMVMEFSINDGAVQLACLFCTTLAPISGYFGWPFGLLAGFLHSALVLSVGSPVSGLNLYNNGFSGGLLAIILYPIITDVVRGRRPELRDEDYFDIIEHESPQMAPEDEVVEPALQEEKSQDVD